jgi:hypothetical protein
MKTIIIALTILTSSFLLGGCLLEEVLTPVFPGEGDTIDTTENPIDIIVIDTPDTLPLECDTVVVTEPKFITIYNEYFNGLPSVDHQFYFHKSQGVDLAYSTLEDLLIGQGYHPDSIEVYQEGLSIAAIVRGTNTKSNLETRIWTRDAVGQKAVFTINIQAFLFGGALTFEEYKQVAQELPSVNIFNFRNTNWTVEQYEEVALIILGECKLGRKEANFMFNLPISCQIYCEFKVRDWNIVRGQDCDCALPMNSFPSLINPIQERKLQYGILSKV